MKKKIVNLLGKLLMLLSFVFITIKLIEYDIDITDVFSLEILIAFVLSILLHSINIVYGSHVYYKILSLITKNSSNKKIVRTIYCQSNLYKYIPGNIMHFVGRNQIAVTTKISHFDVAVSTALEMLFLVFSGSLISLTFGMDIFLNYIDIINIDFFALFAILLVLCLLLTVLFLSFKNKATKCIEKYCFVIKKIGLKKFIILLFQCSFRLIFNAIIFLIILCSFGLKITSVEALLVSISSFVMSWVVGFITPGAPGGLGVREFIMTMALSGYYYEEKLIIALVVYRIVCILGDILSYALLQCVLKINHN